MCGRIRQAWERAEYLEVIHWNPRKIPPDARQPRYKPLLGRRVIVPADGWYEWTGDPGDKQLWFISPRRARADA